MRNIVQFSILVLIVFSVIFAPSLVDAKKLVNISDKSAKSKVIPNHDLCDDIKEDYFVTVNWSTDVRGDNFQIIYDLDKKNKIVQVPKDWLGGGSHRSVYMEFTLPAGEYIFDLLYDNHLVEDSQIRVTIPTPNCSEQTNNELQKNSETTNQQSNPDSNKIKILNKNGSYDNSDTSFICPSTCPECHDLYNIFVHWVLDTTSVSKLGLSTVITNPSQSQWIKTPFMNNELLEAYLSDVPADQYIFELFYDGFPVPNSKIYVTIPKQNCLDQTKTELKKDSGTGTQSGNTANSSYDYVNSARGIYVTTGQNLCDSDPYDYEMQLYWDLSEFKGKNPKLSISERNKDARLYDVDANIDIPGGLASKIEHGKYLSINLPAKPGEYEIKLMNGDNVVVNSIINITIPPPDCSGQTKTALKKNSGTSIPDWIKKSAMWWSEGTTTDREFANALGFLVKEKLIQVPLPTNANGTIIISKNLVIPDWIKKNAGWWSENKISDNDFKEGIKHMINEDIISFNSPIPISNDPPIAPNQQNQNNLNSNTVQILNKGGTSLIRSEEDCAYFVFISWVTDSKDNDFSIGVNRIGLMGGEYVIQIPKTPEYGRLTSNSDKLMFNGFDDGLIKHSLFAAEGPTQFEFELFYRGVAVPNSIITIILPDCHDQTKTELKKDSDITSSTTQTTPQNSGNQTNPQNATQTPYKYYVKPGDIPTIKKDIQLPPKSSDTQEKSQNATASQNATKYTTDKSKVSSSNTQIKIVPKSTTPVTPKPVTPLK